MYLVLVVVVLLDWEVVVAILFLTVALVSQAFDALRMEALRRTMRLRLMMFRFLLISFQVLHVSFYHQVVSHCCLSLKLTPRHLLMMMTTKPLDQAK
jgi:hypothetical protein